MQTLRTEAQALTHASEAWPLRHLENCSKCACVHYPRACICIWALLVNTACELRLRLRTSKSDFRVMAGFIRYYGICRGKGSLPQAATLIAKYLYEVEVAQRVILS